MTIGEAVKARVLELCHEKNLTINRLSIVSGITQSTVNNFISGRNHSITLSTLKKLCDGMEITVPEFFSSKLFEDLEQEVK